MPCWNITMNEVNLESANLDPDILDRALRAEFGQHVVRDADGWIFRVPAGMVSLRGGVLRSRDLSQEGLKALHSQIKRAFSREVLQIAARRFGWQMQKNKDHFLLIKR